MMNYVPISAVKISAKDELRHLNPKDRDCYFTDEYKLVLHKNYTQNNCLFECGLKLSGANNAVICRPETKFESHKTCNFLELYVYTLVLTIFDHTSKTL